MKEIKLWQISQEGENEPPVKPLKNANQTETEKQLEEIIVKYPDLLFDGLKLVGRQTDTAGGPLDLLGVDSDGRLVVFELKRGTLTREAIAQVIDYASFLDEMEPSKLSQHISDRSGNFGIEKIEDFSAWYNEQYQKSIYEIQKPKMILVGLGADDRTRRMVSFLSNNDIDISLITFYGFEQNGKAYLAKQIEVLARPSRDLSSLNKKDRLELLRERVKRMGIDSFYEKIGFKMIGKQKSGSQLSMFKIEGNGIEVISGGIVDDIHLDRVDYVEYKPEMIYTFVPSFGNTVAQWIVRGKGKVTIIYDAVKAQNKTLTFSY